MPKIALSISLRKSQQIVMSESAKLIENLKNEMLSLIKEKFNAYTKNDANEAKDYMIEACKFLELKTFSYTNLILMLAGLSFATFTVVFLIYLAFRYLKVFPKKKKSFAKNEGEEEEGPKGRKVRADDFL